MVDLEPDVAVEEVDILGTHGQARPSESCKANNGWIHHTGQPWRTPQGTPPVRHQAETVNLVVRQLKNEGSVGRNGRERERLKRSSIFFL